MTHRTADMMGLNVKDITCTGYLGTDTGRDLLASIVLSPQMRLTFGFGFRPKVPVYFRCHIRFQPNVIRNFWRTFGYGRKWNFHFRSTSNDLLTSELVLAYSTPCPR